MYAQPIDDGPWSVGGVDVGWSIKRRNTNKSGAQDILQRLVGSLAKLIVVIGINKQSRLNNFSWAVATKLQDPSSSIDYSRSTLLLTSSCFFIQWTHPSVLALIIPLFEHSTPVLGHELL